MLIHNIIVHDLYYRAQALGESEYQPVAVVQADIIRFTVLNPQSQALFSAHHVLKTSTPDSICIHVDYGEWVHSGNATLIFIYDSLHIGNSLIGANFAFQSWSRIERVSCLRWLVVKGLTFFFRQHFTLNRAVLI